MYYRWKDGRIIVKTTFWGGREGDARRTLQELAAHLRGEIPDSQTPQPEADQSVGMVRNGPVRQVQESDRQFSLFFGHLPGDRGSYRGHPVDYKCIAPHAPVEGNRAFDTALESTDGVLMVVQGDRNEVDPAARALDDLTRRLAPRYDWEPADDRTANLTRLFGSDGPLSLVLLVHGGDPELPKMHRELGLPDAIPVVERDPAEPLTSTARAFRKLVDEIRPAMREAAESKRLPI